MSEQDAVTAQLDTLGQHLQLMMKMGLRQYGRRPSFWEVLTAAVLVADGYEQCQEQGKSFRAWVRENMSVSVPTAYRLLKIGQQSDQILAALTLSMP